MIYEKCQVEQVVGFAPLYVLVYPGEHLVAKLTEQLNDAFIVGNGRNEQQEIEFPINQLLEVALRALSRCE